MPQGTYLNSVGTVRSGGRELSFIILFLCPPNPTNDIHYMFSVKLLQMTISSLTQVSVRSLIQLRCPNTEALHSLYTMLTSQKSKGLQDGTLLQKRNPEKLNMRWSLLGKGIRLNPLESMERKKECLVVQSVLQKFN